MSAKQTSAKYSIEVAASDITFKKKISFWELCWVRPFDPENLKIIFWYSQTFLWKSYDNS